MSPTSDLEVARTAFENAERKASAARDLLTTGHAPEALEAATISAEEYAKAMIHGFIHLEVAQLTRRPTGEKWAIDPAALRCHACKHQMFVYSLMGQAVLFPGGYRTNPEAKRAVALRTMSLLVPDIRTNLIGSWIAQPGNLAEATTIFAKGKAMQGRKMRAQYVEEVDGTIRAPSEIRPEEVAELLSLLDRFSALWRIALTTEVPEAFRPLLQQLLRLATALLTSRPFVCTHKGRGPPAPKVAG